MKRILILVHSLLLFCTLSIAQTDTVFWFAAPEISTCGFNEDRPIYLRISTGSDPSSITVSQPANLSFTPISITIPANSAQTINLTPWIDIIENKPANQILNYGLLITATSPINAYYEVFSNGSSPEIFSLKGQNALGYEFYISMQNLLPNTTACNPSALSSFDIIASENNTIVQITPRNDIVGHSANLQFSVNLNAGQCYSATATGHLGMEHLHGSFVVANKPIAITMKDNDIVAVPYIGGTDNAGDQIIPVSRTGKEYILVNGFLNAPHDQAFILATQNGTDVFVDSVHITSLNAGQTYMHNIGIASAAFVYTTHPVYILQLSGFGGEVGLSVLPPVGCTGSNEVSITRSTNESLFLTFLVSAGGESNFLLNGIGNIIDSASFSDVPFTGGLWKYARLSFSTSQIPTGAATRISNSTHLFNMGMIHGGTTGGCRFGYFTDFNNLNLGSDQTMCPGDSLLLDAGSGKQSYLWSTSDTTQTITVTAPGTYWVAVTVGSCTNYDTLVVHPAHAFQASLGPDQTICPGQTLTLTPGTGFASYSWSTNDSTSTLAVTQTGSYWVQGLDTIGCPFTDTINILPCPYTATFFLRDTLICAGETVTLQAPDMTYSGLWEYFEDFENPVGSEWSDTIRFPFNSTTVSGPYGNHQLQLQLNNLPLHDSVEVSFDLYLHDSWDGISLGIGYDFFTMKIDFDTLIHTTFNNHQNSTYQSYPGNFPAVYPSLTGASAILPIRCSAPYTCTALYDMQFVKGHTSGNVNIGFHGAPDQTLCDESWSIDNVRVKLLNTPATSLQYLWSTNDTTPTITVTPGQTTIYTVIVTNGVDTLYDTCFVYVAAANAGPDATICSGDTTQLLAVSGAGGYTWLPSTALSSATVANPQAWPTVTTQYKLGALYQVQGFSRTCYDSATVTVHPLPQPNLGPNITQCQGNPVTLNPGAGFSSYLWSNNAITSTITVNQSGTWWVKVKNSFDCEKTDTIVVNLIPYPQVTLVPAEDTVCSGDTLVIKAISSIPNSTFSWSTGSPADSIIVAPGTLSTYIVTVTNQGCATIDTAIIHTKPQPNPYITATKYMMCDGDTTILMANTLYPMSGFQWSSGQTTQSITVAPSASTTYHVTLSLNGCIQDTSVVIEVNPVPQVNLNAAPIQVCLGDSTEITAVSSVWGTQFSWSTGQTGNKIVNYPQTPVNISVIGTVNGCTGYDTVHIQTKPVPDVQVAVSQNPICMGDTVVMTATSTLAGCSFIWSTGAVTAQISETPWFGTVYMVIATLNGCYIDTTFVVDVNPRPVLTISPTPVDLCIGDQAVITVTSDLPGTSFSWNNGMTGSPITFTPASSSVLGVTGAVNGCEQTDWVAVNVHPYPTVDLGPDSYICDKETITLQPAGNYALLTWWDGTTGMQKSIYEPGTYWVTAGLQQCSASDTVTYLECPSLVVPNAFTPNGDGLNDEFYPVHKTLDIKSIHIYNRWGAQIFYTINPTDRWDGTINGKPCPEGVYFYVIRYYNPMINIHQEKGGAVHLLR
jgi:gliding motility-associated-like protein